VRSNNSYTHVNNLGFNSYEYQQVQPTSASTLEMTPDPAFDMILDADPPYDNY
jgi:hypothetical protein